MPPSASSPSSDESVSESEDSILKAVEELGFLPLEEMVSEQSCGLGNLYPLLSSKREPYYISQAEIIIRHMRALQVCATSLEQRMALTYPLCLPQCQSTITIDAAAMWCPTFILITILASKAVLICYFQFVGYVSDLVIG